MGEQNDQGYVCRDSPFQIRLKVIDVIVCPVCQKKGQKKKKKPILDQESCCHDALQRAAFSMAGWSIYTQMWEFLRESWTSHHWHSRQGSPNIPLYIWNAWTLT